MPRFRKLKKAADISVSSLTSPAELVQNLRSLHQGGSRGSRALAASSTAIALSIGFAFPDTRDTSGDGAVIQGEGAGWQTAYGAVRMAVEAIKECADLCLPLKAVAGAIYVLMKNYDVSVPVCELNTSSLFACFLFQQTLDNMDGVRGIERRVQSLSGVLASPVSEDDHAEKRRRVELQRFALG